MRGLKNLSTLSSVRSSAALLAVLMVGVMPVSAMAKERKPPEPKPCPTDTNIVVASSEITKRFSVLSECTAQIVEMPAAPDPYPHQGSVTISSDSDSSGYVTTASSDGGKRDMYPVIVEKGEQAGVRYVRIIPPDQPAETYYGATPYGVPNAPIYAPTPGTPVMGTGNGMTIASTGAVAAGQMPVAAAAPAGGGVNDASVLSLRPRSYASQYDNMIEQAARRHGVDPLVLHSVIFQESRYKNHARSHVGARGLMQIMPATGAGLGVRNSAHLYDPATNIDAGAKLLRQLWGKYNGRFDLVLAAYNAGPGAVAKYGQRVPPYRETRDYVVKVQGHYKKLAAENGMTPAGF